jgi:hypothetical protein
MYANINKINPILKSLNNLVKHEVKIRRSKKEKSFQKI